MFRCQICKKLSAPKEKAIKLTTGVRQKQDEEGFLRGLEIVSEVTAHQKCVDANTEPPFFAKEIKMVKLPKYVRAVEELEEEEDYE